MVIIKSNWFLFTALVLAFIISSCAVSENFGENAEVNKTQQIEINTSFENAYRTAIQVAAERNWSVKNSDSSAGFFRAETPGSARVWSDEVNVTIIEEEGKTKITVRSNLGQEPNRKIVSDFLTDLKSRIEN
jgi:hypothetical protein